MYQHMLVRRSFMHSLCISDVWCWWPGCVCTAHEEAAAVDRKFRFRFGQLFVSAALHVVGLRAACRQTQLLERFESQLLLESN